jgi:hypothetical protein
VKPLTILSILVALLLASVCATAQTCAGHIKTQAQLLTEWQACAAQGSGPGCLTALDVQDIICSPPTVNGGAQLVPSTLTNGSTIAVNLALANVFTITLSGTNQTIQCPSGVTSGDWETVSFVIQQPSSGSPDNLLWDTCWLFNAGTPPRTDNGGLSLANNAVDMVTCNVNNVSGTYAGLCGGANGTNNLASSSTFVLRTNHTFTNGTCSSGTTCAVTITNSMANDLRTVEFSSSASAAPTTVTDGTNNCTIDTASYNNGATGGAATGIAYCPKITPCASNSCTITVTWPGSVSFPFVFAQEWVPSTTAPIAGIGNTASGTSGANPSVSTSGATTQANQLVIAMVNQGDSPAANACTLIDKETSSGHNLVQYTVPGTTGVKTCSLTATSSNYDYSITSFLHY